MKPPALAAAAAAAVVALAACSGTAATSGAPRTLSQSAIQVVNCRQKYNAWAQGPAKELVAALNAVDSASTAKDKPALTAALKQAGPAVVSSAHYPIPACADPKGYWTPLLMHVNAAAGNAGSASGLSDLKGLPEIERKLGAELKRTTGA